jgi:hypothetical protein
VGIDPLQFLHCEDSFELAVMAAVVERGERLLDQMIDRLAYKLAKATWGDGT